MYSNKHFNPNNYIGEKMFYNIYLLFIILIYTNIIDDIID